MADDLRRCVRFAIFLGSIATFSLAAGGEIELQSTLEQSILVISAESEPSSCSVGQSGTLSLCADVPSDAILSFEGSFPVQFSVASTASEFSISNASQSDAVHYAILSRCTAPVTLDLSLGQIIALGESSVAIGGGADGIVLQLHDSSSQSSSRLISGGNLAMESLLSFHIDSTQGWTFDGGLDLSSCQNGITFTQSSLTILQLSDLFTQSDNITHHGSSWISFGSQSLTIAEGAILRVTLPESCPVFSRNSQIRLLEDVTDPASSFNLQVFDGSGADLSSQWSPHTSNSRFFAKFQGAPLILSELICDQNGLTLTQIYDDDSAARFSIVPGVYNTTTTDESSPSVLSVNGQSIAYGGKFDGPAAAIDTCNYFVDADCVSRAPASWEACSAVIDLGSNGLISSQETSAIGNWLTAVESAENCDDLPLHYSRIALTEKFLSPNVILRGNGTVSGRKAFSIIASASEISNDGISSDYRREGYMTEGPASIGSLSIGGDESAIAISGPIEMRIFAGPLPLPAVSAPYSCVVGDFTLSKNSSQTGNILLDASMYADSATSVYVTSHHSIGNISVGGEINGSLCATAAPWVESAAATLGVSELPANFSIGNVSIAGSITAPTGAGILLDAAPHWFGERGSESYLSGDVGELQIWGSSASPASICAQSGTAMVIRSLSCSSLTMGNASLSGHCGLLCDCDDVTEISIGTASNFNAPVSISSESASSAVALVGRNMSLSVYSDLNLDSPSGLSIGGGTGTYAYSDGATELTNISPLDAAAAKNRVTIAHKDANLSCSGAVELCDLTFINGESDGAAAIIFGGDLTVAEKLILCGPCESFHAATINLFTAESATCLAAFCLDSPSIVIAAIDASLASVVDSGFVPTIALGGLPSLEDSGIEAPTVSILQSSLDYTGIGTISGNLVPDAYASGMENSCVQVILAGPGGELGNFPGESSIANVGRLIVDTQSGTDGSWTINGDVSCGELKILHGKLIQKGTLKIFGNMLLLGCDIDWEDSIFNGGIYAAEDTIHARRGSMAVIRNGFSADDVSESGDLQNFFPSNLRREAVLLGGDARFIVDRKAKSVTFQIAGDHESEEAPAAIRVCGNTEFFHRPLSTQLRFGERYGNGNCVDLSRSLDISFYNGDGTPYEGTGMAIAGNRNTEVVLREGTAESSNSFSGAISNVGQTKVFGHWSLPDGFRDCGRIVIGQEGRIDIGNKFLDARSLQFNINSHREEAYLRCGGLARRIALELVFGNDSLANPEAQRYCLIDGLINSEATLTRIHQLNCGFDFETDGDGIYVTFDADANVSSDSPRRIYYKGFLGGDFGRHLPAILPFLLPANDTALIDFPGEDSCSDCGESACNWDNDLDAFAITIQLDLGPTLEDIAAVTRMISGLLAQTAAKTQALLQESFDARCCDVKGNGNDPFVSAIGAHATRSSGGAEGKTTFYGISGGADYRWNFGEDRYLRGGAFLGYVRGEVRGGLVPSFLLQPFWDASLRVHQNSFVGGIFAAYESFDSRHRKTNLEGTVSCGLLKNKISGEGAPSGAGSEDSYDGRSFSADLRAVRNLVSCRGWQMGPWAGIAYQHLWEKGPVGPVGSSSVSTGSDLVRTILGANVEREFSPFAAAPDRLLRAYARIGWCWQGTHSSVSCDGSEGFNLPSTPLLDGAYGDRNSAVATVGFRQKLSAHWDLSGSWNGDFSAHYASNKLTATVGYSF